LILTGDRFVQLLHEVLSVGKTGLRILTAYLSKFFLKFPTGRGVSYDDLGTGLTIDTGWREFKHGIEGLFIAVLALDLQFALLRITGAKKLFEFPQIIGRDHIQDR